MLRRLPTLWMLLALSGHQKRAGRQLLGEEIEKQ